MSKYCPNCCKLHSYIEEECSCCGTKLKWLYKLDFLKKAFERVFS